MRTQLDEHMLWSLNPGPNGQTYYTSRGQKKKLSFLVVGATSPMLWSYLGQIHHVPSCGFKAMLTPLPTGVLAFLLRHVLCFVALAWLKPEVHIFRGFEFAH